MKYALLFLALCGCNCAHNPPAHRPTVTHPDGSARAPVWACYYDDAEEDNLVCLDLKSFLRYLAQEETLEFDAPQVHEL